MRLFLLQRRAYSTAFQDHGVSNFISQRLHESYPHVWQPTPLQSTILNSVLNTNHSLIIQDWTGSGKSFAVLLAMLSTKGKNTPKNTPNYLLIVPHNALVHQYQTWISNLSNEATTSSKDSTCDDKIAQFLIRDSTDPDPKKRVYNILDNPPKILITTPQRLYDLVIETPKAKERDIRRLGGKNHLPSYLIPQNQISDKVKNKLREMISRIPAIVLEEADALIKTPHLRSHHSPKQIRKLLRKTQTHQIVDRLVKSRTHLIEPSVKQLRLICLSASVSSRFRHFVARKSEWLPKDQYLDVISDYTVNSTEPSEPSIGDNDDDLNHEEHPHKGTTAQLPNFSTIPSTISHSAVLSVPTETIPIDLCDFFVSHYSKKKTESSSDKTNDINTDSGDNDNFMSKIFKSAKGVKDSNQQEENQDQEAEELKEKASQAPFEQDHHFLRSIIYTMAAEQCQRGLLFIPDNASLDRVVEAFQYMGAPVYKFNSDLPPTHPEHPTSILSNLENQNKNNNHNVDDQQQAPAAIFATYQSGVRGMDIPSLTHVFIPFLPESNAEYTHMAGRVGRLGGGEGGQERRQGKVVSIIHGKTLNNDRKSFVTGLDGTKYLVPKRLLNIFDHAPQTKFEAVPYEGLAEAFDDIELVDQK